MRTHIAQIVLATVIVGASTHDALAQMHRRAPRRASSAKAANVVPPLPCGDYMSFQVLLDRQGFSPGQIDGRPGKNFDHALAAWRIAKNMAGPVATSGVAGAAANAPDCGAWKALGGDTAQPLTTYTITKDDVDGPFQKEIPKSLDAQAGLPSLSYQSAAELLGEKFHAAPALLEKLNPAVAYEEARTIKAPAVQPFDWNAKLTPDAAAGDVEITVSRADSALRVTRADGSIVHFAPVTTGSVHDPLPTGDYKVTVINWHPPFHYNPDLFWDAKPGDTKATIKPGPNNPVGVVWISLSLEHYGIHGTPEPGNIAKTESHGCVRLTNWDAARVAALVKPGTPVHFR